MQLTVIGSSVGFVGKRMTPGELVNMVSPQSASEEKRFPHNYCRPTGCQPHSVMSSEYNGSGPLATSAFFGSRKGQKECNNYYEGCYNYY